MKGTVMAEIAAYLCFMSVCIVVMFTTLGQAGDDIVEMVIHTESDARQLQVLPYNITDYSYLSREGAYLDAKSLAVSVASASADSRSDIRVLGEIIDSRDMYALNLDTMTQTVPKAYLELEKWWEGFSRSSVYNGSKSIYTYDDPSSKRTFSPSYINSGVSGYTYANPRSLDECKFKMRVVEVGTDVEGKAILEYHVYVFLGSLVRATAGEGERLEYRWHEIVLGGDWVLMK